jgi:hypothetical protein
VTVSVDRNKTTSDQSLAISGSLPLEAALVAAAMALVTIVAPYQRSATAHLYESMVIGFAGFMLFIVAKMSLFTANRWSTWGPRSMRPPFKAAYIAGYLMMGIGNLGVIALLL